MEGEKNGDERLGVLREGDSVATPAGDIARLPVPSWYDAHKFNRAKEVYKDYFASVNFSHLCGLLLGFYFTKNVKTLRSTGESETKTTLFHRYLQTIRHIQKWYEGDVWDPSDPAHRSLSLVRAMHARTGRKMAALEDGVVYVSQWDMAVTQWAFVGPMVLFRSRMGLHDCSEGDFDSLVHFWRTVGYLLGIEDRYNLCDGTHAEVMDACRTMLEAEYVTRIAAADETSVGMARKVVSALSMIDYFLTWPALSTYVHELVGLPCPEAMGLFDRLCHNGMRFIMLYAMRVLQLRTWFNDVFRWRLDVAEKKDRALIKQAAAKTVPNKTTVSAG